MGLLFLMPLTVESKIEKRQATAATVINSVIVDTAEEIKQLLLYKKKNDPAGLSSEQEFQLQFLIQFSSPSDLLRLKQIEKVLSQFIVCDDKLKVIMKIMLEEMEIGLKEENSKSPLKMLPSYVSTLMATTHSDRECQIGVIVGTGTNACYVEKTSHCQKLGHEIGRESEEVIINTEWGAFGDNGRINFIRNFYDKTLDIYSVNSGKQIFEKTIGEMYTGELVRLVLNDLHNRGLVFEGKNADVLLVPNKFPTKFISEVETDSLDPEKSYHRTIDIFTELGVEDVDVRDCGIVARVCSVVAERAAHLCAAGVAVLLNRMEKPHVTVGVDGSVFRFHPTFKNCVENKIRKLVEPNLSFSLKLFENGGGLGAALVAAVARRIEIERKLSP